MSSNCGIGPASYNASPSQDNKVPDQRRIVWNLPGLIIAGLSALIDSPTVEAIFSLCGGLYSLVVGILFIGVFSLLADERPLSQAINPAYAWRVVSALEHILESEYAYMAAFGRLEGLPGLVAIVKKCQGDSLIRMGVVRAKEIERLRSLTPKNDPSPTSTGSTLARPAKSCAACWSINGSTWPK